jgi:hypothetical protein
VRAQGSVLDQKISIKLKQATLEQLLLKIESKTTIKFSYTQKILNESKQNYNFKNEPLGVVLNTVLKPNRLQYALMYGNVIVITAIDKSTPKYTISGYVNDIETGERLIGALVYNTITFQSCFTNQDGYYSLLMPKDSLHLGVEYVGYEKGYIDLKLDKNTQIDFGIKSNLEYLPKRVTGTYGTGIETKSNTFVLNSKTIKKLPLLFGESDVLKSLLLLPGVISEMTVLPI